MFAYLIRARDDPWKVPLLFILTFDNRLDDRWVIGAEIDENVCDTGLVDGQ
jgi:hypothetical protein